MMVPEMFSPAKPRLHRKRRPRPRNGVGPVAGPPVLVSATYETGAWVRLVFDRAVGAPGALAPGMLTLQDGPGSGADWLGGAVTVVGPTVLRVALSETGPSGSAQTLLSATGATGIVSAFDGTGWAGVMDVVLPFGA